VFNLQLAYFPSYIAMFALGLAARRGRWLGAVQSRFAWRGAAVCVGAALAAWLPLLALGGALQGHEADFAGGLHWQSAALSGWEALVCVGMSLGVLAGFRDRFAGQGRIARFMSDNAFAVYVIHPPILVALAVALAPFAAPPEAKFLLLWGLGAAVSFGVAAPLVRRIPGLGTVLQ
jgi:hypothetical protein